MRRWWPVIGRRAGRRFHPGGPITAWLIATPVLVPLLVVLSSLFAGDTGVWAHLQTHVLPTVAINSLWLLLGVATGTGLIGTVLAWLVAACEFPGRRFFSWSLLLPMAVPAYVMAFVLIGMLDYSGPLQSWMRAIWGPDAGLPPIRSRGGVILALVLVLYPYVYLIARNAFATQGARGLEVARSMGMTPLAGFFRVALPLARPWIAAGVMLVMMETLADFGTVAAFNYSTFTTAIFKSWYDLQSITAAMQLSSVLVLAVLALVLCEQLSRRRTRYTETGAGHARRFRLRGMAAFGAAGFCLLVLTVAFVIPALQLLGWALANLTDLDQRYLALAARSVGLAGLSALLGVTIALLLAYAVRRSRGWGAAAGARVATIGYAVPGPVLAVGLALPLIWLSGLVQFVMEGLADAPARSVVLQGSLFGLVVAYVGRFLAVAHNPVHANLMRVSPTLDDAARGMGRGPLGVIGGVHLPLVRGGLLTGAILVFVDVMKEMPITLMMRPFGFETLALRVYQMTAEGHWERAAVPALALVLVGLVPVIMLTRRLDAGESPRRSTKPASLEPVNAA